MDDDGVRLTRRVVLGFRVATQRFVGCAAGDKITMQPRNTLTQLKRLLGKK